MKLNTVVLFISFCFMHESICMFKQQKAPEKPKIERLLQEDAKTDRPIHNAPRMRAVIEISSRTEWQQGETENTTALDLRHNNLSQLPEPFRYPKLQELDCSDNIFARIPTQLYASSLLKHLFFSNNRIGLIPEFIGKMKHLAVIVAAHNVIKEIHPAIGQIKTLTYLDVSHNSLDKLPSSLATLPQLAYLNLTQNPLSPYILFSFQKALPKTLIEH